MPAKTPYTYRRADGTYYARFLILSAIRQAFPELPREYRFSLRCRSKFEADQTVVDYRQQGAQVPVGYRLAEEPQAYKLAEGTSCPLPKAEPLYTGKSGMIAPL